MEAARERSYPGGGYPPPPFPMWLLPIDFVRVRGRSNTCYRVGWKRVEGEGGEQVVEKEEEEEERGIGGERVARDEEGNSRWIATEERGERRGDE